MYNSNLKIVLMFLCFFRGILETKASICLTWKTGIDSSLTIKCKISNIYSKVTIKDQYGQAQGYCALPYPKPFCRNYYRNSSITQNLNTHDTVFKVRGKIDSRVNGNWSCHHGTNVEVAYVDVNVITGNVLTPASVSITGPTYIKTGQPVWFTCVSTRTPKDKSARIFVDNQLFTTLSKQTDGCFSSASAGYCNTDDCQCSGDGKSYIFRHKGFTTSSSSLVTCQMDIDSYRSISDCTVINIIDMEGPYITSDTDLPFISLTTVELTCYVSGDIGSVILEWSCLNVTDSPLHYRNSSFFASKLSLRVKSSYQDAICQCTAKNRNIQSSADFRFDTRRIPILGITGSTICNSSESAKLICNASKGGHNITFASWIHFFNGKVIRHLQGISTDHLSTLLINNCMFEDAGDYMCRAFYSENRINVWSNISRHLVVNGIPVLIQRQVNKESNITLSIIFHSIPKPYTPSWNLFNEELKNSTKYYIIFHNRTIALQMHGVLVLSEGYITNVTYYSFPIQTTQFISSVVIENGYGNLTEKFILNVQESKLFHIRDIVWFITAAVTVIIMIGIASLLLYSRFRARLRLSASMRAIYFAAQQSSSNTRDYDETIAHYEEIQVHDHPNISTSHGVEELDKEENGDHPRHQYMEVL